MTRYGEAPVLHRHHHHQQEQLVGQDVVVVVPSIHQLEMMSLPYLGLWFATHIGEIAYLAVCALLAYLSTENGSRNVVRIFQSTLGDSSGDDVEGWTARSVFRCVVFFESGLLLGSNFMVIAFETLIGIEPISIVSFGVAGAINLAVSVLLVQTYDFHLHACDWHHDSHHGRVMTTRATTNTEEDSSTEHDDQASAQYYVALV